MFCVWLGDFCMVFFVWCSCLVLLYGDCCMVFSVLLQCVWRWLYGHCVWCLCILLLCMVLFVWCFLCGDFVCVCCICFWFLTFVWCFSIYVFFQHVVLVSGLCVSFSMLCLHVLLFVCLLVSCCCKLCLLVVKKTSGGACVSCFFILWFNLLCLYGVLVYLCVWCV